MAGNYDGLARMLVLNIGGKDNVVSVSHSTTDLLFVLKDVGQANTDLIQSLDGVVSVVRGEGQYQIRIGSHVPEVYESVLRTGKMEELGTAHAGGQQDALEKRRRSIGAWLVGLLVFVAIEALGIVLLDIQINAGTILVMLLGLACGTLLGELWDRRQKKLARGQGGAGTDSSGHKPSPSARSEEIVAPIKGRVIPLEQLSDDAFASGVLGKGLGFEPAEGKLYAPCSGEITTFFPTGHAIGIHSDNGAEILIHVGLGTVKLKGKGFSPKKQQGDRTEKGELLLEFELDSIREAGLSVETPMVISNSGMYKEIVISQKSEVEPGDLVITTEAIGE